MNTEHNAQSTSTCTFGEALGALITVEMQLAGPLPSIGELRDHLQRARAALRKPSHRFETLFRSLSSDRTLASAIVNSRLSEQSLTVLLGTLTALIQGRPVNLSEQVTRIVGEGPPVPLGDVGISYQAVRCLDAADVYSALTRHRSGPTLRSVGNETLPNRCWVSEFTSGKGHRYSLTTLAGKGTMIFTAAEANAFDALTHSNPGNN